MEQYTVTPDLYASKGTRLANNIIDGIFRLVLIVALLFVAQTNFFEGESFTLYLFDFISCLAYYILLEGLIGTSVGKLITGTKVVMEDGSKPDFGTIIKRTFCRFIPFNAIAGLLGDNNLFWHDSFSNTYVVNAKKLEESQNSFPGTIASSEAAQNY